MSERLVKLEIFTGLHISCLRFDLYIELYKQDVPPLLLLFS